MSQTAPGRSFLVAGVFGGVDEFTAPDESFAKGASSEALADWPNPGSWPNARQ